MPESNDEKARRIMDSVPDFSKTRAAFDKKMDEIRTASAKAREEENVAFEKRMAVRRIVKFGLMFGAVACIYVAVKNRNEKPEEE